MNFMGGHVIKRAWGGEDNYINIVVWQKETEDEWEAKFEKEVEERIAKGYWFSLRVDVQTERETFDELEYLRIYNNLEDFKEFKDVIDTASQHPGFRIGIENEKRELREKVSHGLSKVPIKMTGWINSSPVVLINNSGPYMEAVEYARHHIKRIFLMKVAGLRKILEESFKQKIGWFDQERNPPTSRWMDDE